MYGAHIYVHAILKDTFWAEAMSNSENIMPIALVIVRRFICTFSKKYTGQKPATQCLHSWLGRLKPKSVIRVAKLFTIL